MQTISLSQPSITDLERKYVNEVLDGTQLALGPWLTRFEDLMAKQCQTKYAVAINSGTAGLHMVVDFLSNEKRPEVITTPFSFVASSNCLLYNNLTPQFVDIDPDTLNISPDQVEQAVTSKTGGILAVDVFGTPADWPQFESIAQKHDLFLVDDSCEALGASINNKPIGAWADAGIFGFYPNKQITTGEGGCITTDNLALAQFCRSMRNQGRATDGKMEHINLGYNFRLPELSAAIGCAQLERLDELIEKRKTLAGWYQKALSSLQDELILPHVCNVDKQSWFVYVIRLKESDSATRRDQIMHILRDKGIGCAPYFPTIHLQPYYRKKFGFKEGDFPITESISQRSLALPFHPNLSQTDIETVISILKSALVQTK